MKHNILFLDDNYELTTAVSEYLAKAGFEVDCVHTTAEAMDRMAKKNYSVVLVDLRLSRGGPLVEGFNFACQVRRQVPSALLVLFSGWLTPEIEIETVRRRMKTIAKPTPLPALRAMISTYLRERPED